MWRATVPRVQRRKVGDWKPTEARIPDGRQHAGYPETGLWKMNSDTC
jgi:hypothetical protein